MIRTKTVAIDGASVTIGGLSLEQVEEFLKPIPDAEANKIITKKTLELVCWGLNNALKEGAPKWDAERIRKDMDLVMFRELQKEIIVFSGLRIVEKNGARLGEDQAPSDKVILTTSDGALQPQPGGHSNISVV